ncbi:MAG: ParB/RepB/Spo0J family partition protein [Terriglobales bacterium]
MTTVNTAVDKGSEKAGAVKGHEKLAEKRRALGRGLESLLPGPRVVPAAAAVDSSSSAPTLPQNTRKDGAPETSGSEKGSQFAAAGSHDAGAPSEGEAAGSARLEGGIPGTLDHLQAVAEGRSADGETVFVLAIDQIDPNPYQTRNHFDREALTELMNSIKVQGVLQPIVVRPGKEGRFVLVLGERRLRASKMAERTTIPVIVKRVSDQQAAEMTLVENLQREDLNCIEQAEAFASLSTDFKLTQEEIGTRAGVSRETVSNYMRLLSLPESVVGALQMGKLTYSHARVLLHLRDNVTIWTLAKRAIEEKMSVAKLEDLVLGVSTPPGQTEKNKGGGARWVDPNVKAAQRTLEEVLGMKVRIRDRKGRGKIMIEYATLEDFDLVVRMLKGQ